MNDYRVVLASLLYAAAAVAIEPPRPGQEWFVKRAVFAEGRLWMLSDAGQLSSVGPAEERRTEEILPGPIVDICRSSGSLVAITGKRESRGTWVVRKRMGTQWSIEATVETKHDGFGSLTCSADGMTLLSERRVIEIANGKVIAVALSEPLRLGLIESVYADPEKLLVGINAGEWGGGLRRIDRRTGKVTTIEQNATGELCGGPLNSNCDPVHGIEAEPWQPSCVAVAIGLVHLLPHGRIVEVCGDKVRRLYYKQYGDEPLSESKGRGDEPAATVAFFGLVRTGDVLWAAGMDGLYKVETGQVTQTMPLPKFNDVGGISVSFAVPNLVLVITGINKRRSVSAGVPMLIAR